MSWLQPAASWASTAGVFMSQHSAASHALTASAASPCPAWLHAGARQQPGNSSIASTVSSLPGQALGLLGPGHSIAFVLSWHHRLGPALPAWLHKGTSQQRTSDGQPHRPWHHSGQACSGLGAALPHVP